jgi:excinuclease UvrABC nuclease subunit
VPVAGDEYGFTSANVDKSPDKPGVYALLDSSSGVLYYGMSEVSIRSRLQDHLNGREGACTQKAKKYKREVTTAATAAVREEQLLSAFKKANGQLPRCNKRAS